MSGAAEFRQRLGRVESLVMALEDLPDTAAREAARGLVRALLDLHALGVRRVLELSGEVAVNRFVDDPLVSSLLLLHELHPLSAMERLNRALEPMQPWFHTIGGGVKVVRATEDEVHLCLCGDAAAGPALRARAMELVIEFVPDVATVEIEEAWDAGRVALPLLTGRSENAP